MKILIIKFGAMGDVLRTTGILRPLKRKYGDCEIWWLTVRKSKTVLKNNPYIDRIIDFESRDYEALLKRLEMENFGIVINLEESGYAARITSALDAEKFGFIWKKNSLMPTPTARRYWSMSAFGLSPENDILKKNNRETYQQLVADILKLGDPVEKPYLHVPDGAVRFAHRFFKKKGLGLRTVGINFGSGKRWITKRMGSELTGKLVSGLHSRGYDIVVFGGEEEEGEISELRKQFPFPVYASGLSISRFAALIGMCRVLVTTDTFALHVAIAVDTGVIALFGPTSSAEIELFSNGSKLVAPLKCICCYRKECNEKPFCMESFDVDHILEKIGELH